MTIGDSIRNCFRVGWNWLQSNYVLAALSVPVIFVLAYFAGSVMNGSPNREPIVMDGNVTRVNSSDGPRWTKLEQHLDHCHDQLQQQEDAESVTFFKEASAAQPGDMQDAMNRYLYFAIMHAVVLGRPSTDRPGQKVGMREVSTYLNVMLKTMKNEEITSKDATTEFKEMNRYLYLTIVQAGVLRSSYPRPDPTPPLPGPTPPPAPPPTPPTPTPEQLLIKKLKDELQEEKERATELLIKKLKDELQEEKERANDLQKQVDDLKKDLQEKEDNAVKLNSELKTCQQKAADCNNKLEGCLPVKHDEPVIESHGQVYDEEED